MSEEKKTPVNAPEDLNVTEDVIPERLIKTTDEVHTGGETKRIFIPNAAESAPEEAPRRRFIKTDEADFVSVRAEKLKAEDATEVSSYADRLDVSAVPENVHTGHTGKINTYDTVHAPAGGRMIDGSLYEEQLTLKGLEKAAAAETEAESEPDPDLIPDEAEGGPTRTFDMRGDRLREIADTANDDVRRNPDQMMMEGFDEIGKKTEEEIAKDEKLRDELKLSRAERVKNFRFWDSKEEPKAPADAPADGTITKTKKMTAMPAFCAKFAARFAHIGVPFTPVKTGEYTDGGSRRAVFDAIKQGRARALIGVGLTAAFALILLITDLAAKVTAGGNNGFFTVLGGNVNALAAFNLVFLLLTCGVMLPDLKNGAVTVLQLRPKTEALLLLLMGSALLQTIAAFFTQQKLASDFQLLSPAAALVCVPYMLSKAFYYDNARQVFKTVSAKSEKSCLRKVSDPELRARLGVEDSQNAVYAGRTRAISGFPASAESAARDEMPATRICAAIAAVSLIAALITLIVKKSVVGGLTVLTLCLALALPVCSLAACGFFLSRANGKLSLKSGFIQTYGDAKSVTAIDMVACDAAELFDAEISNCLTAKGVSEKQVRFAAAAAAAGADSMIRKVFAPEMETYADKMPPAKNTVYEDKMGVSSYVGGCTVLLGNHDMMLNHNVSVPNEDVVMRFLHEDETPLYLAMEGKFTALFAVKYTCPEEVKQGMKELVNGGAVLLLSTTDPNVNDASAEALLGLPENSVRMIGSAAAKKLSAARSAVSDEEETGIVFTDSFLSLSRVAGRAVKLDALNTVAKAVSLGGSLVSLLIGVILAFTGAFTTTDAFTVLALQAVWTALCFASPFFTETAMKLLRRFTGLKKEKPTPDAPAAPEPTEGEQMRLAAPAAEETETEAEIAEDKPAADAADEAAAQKEEESDGLEEFLLPDAVPEAPAEKAPQTAEDDMLAALGTFAPKEEAPKPKAPEEAKGKFIASPALKASLSAMDEFYNDLTADEPAAPGAGKDEFSLYGKNPAGRHVKTAGDIESDYEQAKADEKALRRAFTAPEAPKAPIFDLRRRAPEPKEEKPEPPLDTSDVNVYNDELFRRFEDDSVFAGLHEEDDREFTF